MKLIARKASGPWQHFYALLCQTTNNGTPNALGRLVWCGTSRIINDFEALLDTSIWAPVLMEHAEDAKPSEGFAHRCIGYSASQLRWVLIEGWFAASFNWISRYCFWVSTLQTSAVRKGMVWARRLLREENLSSTSRKIKTLLQKRTGGGSGGWRASTKPRAGSLCGTRQSMGWRFTEYGGIEFQGAPENQKKKHQTWVLTRSTRTFRTSSMMQLGTKDATTRLECSEVTTSSRVPQWSSKGLKTRRSWQE